MTDDSRGPGCYTCRTDEARCAWLQGCCPACSHDFGGLDVWADDTPDDPVRQFLAGDTDVPLTTDEVMEVLRELAALDMTKAHVARLFRTSTNTIREWTAGRRIPPDRLGYPRPELMAEDGAA